MVQWRVTLTTLAMHFEFTHLDATDAAVAHPLHALLQAAHAQEAALVGVADLPALRRSVLDLQGANDDWLGAWAGERLVGALALHADPDDEAVIAVGSLVTHPEHQRQGVASLLLHAAVVSQGRRMPLSAQVLEANAPALALLRAAKFKPVRQWVELQGGQRLRWVKLLRLPA